MEQRVIKIAAIFMVLFMAVTCVVLFYLPGFHEKMVAAQEQTMSQEDAGTHMDMVEIGSTDGAAEEEITFSQQLRITLPDGVTQEQVSIQDQYVTQTVDIMFPGAGTDYLYHSPIIGRSDHIDNLTFESEGGQGVIEITLDKVFEVQPTFLDGYLYLDFISLHDIYDKVVVIDAGHGGNMPGATIGGQCEKDIDLAIVLQLKQIFEENPDSRIGVYYTRVDDTNPSFEDRVGLANKSDADLFISVHNNSTVSGKTSSVMVRPSCMTN